MKDKLTIIDFMKEIYNTYNKDWMGFKITEENPLTYHHPTFAVDLNLN